MIPYNPQRAHHPKRWPQAAPPTAKTSSRRNATIQAWRLLAEKFREPIIIVLLVAAALSLAMGFVEGNFTETIGILCAILLATCVGFLFEWDAMRRFRRLHEPCKRRASPSRYAEEA